MDLTSYFLEDRCNKTKWKLVLFVRCPHGVICFASHKNIMNDRKKMKKTDIAQDNKEEGGSSDLLEVTQKVFLVLLPSPLFLCLSPSLQSLSWQEFPGIKESICFPFRHIMRFRRLHLPPNTHTQNTECSFTPLPRTSHLLVNATAQSPRSSTIQIEAEFHFAIQSRLHHDSLESDKDSYTSYVYQLLSKHIAEYNLIVHCLHLRFKNSHFTFVACFRVRVKYFCSHHWIASISWNAYITCTASQTGGVAFSGRVRDEPITLRERTHGVTRPAPFTHATESLHAHVPQNQRRGRSR